MASKPRGSRGRFIGRAGGAAFHATHAAVVALSLAGPALILARCLGGRAGEGKDFTAWLIDV
ncbi:MAG: hypothetical protein HRF43_13300, partial [Phycisphaerae bacterium]